MMPSNSEADDKAANYAGHVEVFMEARGVASITMTDATQAIWGTSGRGNPNAVRIIEAVASLGYLHIKRVGKRKRLVSRTDKPISTRAFSDEDRSYWLKSHQEELEMDRG